LELQWNLSFLLAWWGMEWLTIGELAGRSGVATSALRFYETKGLIVSRRTDGNQRRYPRATLRRVALIRAGQEVGLSLAELAAALETLPHASTPTKADWERLSKSWRQRLDTQIGELMALRDELTDCIGCGCLSLKSCALFNPGDRASDLGSGPRYLLGDNREDALK
jgi:MerR family transcriptional regulator, redox-sensitive transcriptional activator SoxR